MTQRRLMGIGELRGEQAVPATQILILTYRLVPAAMLGDEIASHSDWYGPFAFGPVLPLEPITELRTGHHALSDSVLTMPMWTVSTGNQKSGLNFRSSNLIPMVMCPMQAVGVCCETTFRVLAGVSTETRGTE